MVAEPLLACSKEEVLSATGSKYCPAPVALGIRDILKAPCGRYAFVGLPCHIRALKNAESQIPGLKEKIAVRIGLFCNHTPLPKATLDLLSENGIQSNNINEIIYRAAKTNPSTMKISTKDGFEVAIKGYWGSGFGQLYYPPACMTCPDHTNEEADISVGDPWDLIENDCGKTLVLVRTDAGDSFLTAGIDGGAVTVEAIEISAVENSLRKKIHSRKEHLHARLALSNCLGRTVPNFNPNPPRAPLQAFVSAFAFYAEQSLMRRNAGRKLFLSLHPPSIIRTVKD